MTDYLPHLLAAGAFALLCGGWVMLQRWIARTEPEVKGPETGGGRCGDCSCGGRTCEGENEGEARQREA